MHTRHPSAPSFPHTHTYTRQTYPPPHTPTRQWFYVPCRHPVLSHFLLVCHTVSLFLFCTPSVFLSSPARSLPPSLHPINKCWHFLPQLRKKQLKAIDPRRTLMHGRAWIHTDMHILTRKRTHTQTRAQPWICKWVSLTFKDRGKPGDFILHGTATGYICPPPSTLHTQTQTHTHLLTHMWAIHANLSVSVGAYMHICR